MQHSSDPTIAPGDNAQTKFVDPPSSMFTLKNEPTIADAIPDYKAPTRQGKKKNAKKNAATAATANIVTTKTIRMTVIADLKAILALILVNLTLLWVLALHIPPNVFYKNFAHVQIANSNGSTVYGILILAFVILGALAIQTNSPICGLLNPCSKLIPFYIFPGLAVYFLFEASSVAAHIDHIFSKTYGYTVTRFFLDVFCCISIAGLLVVFFIFALRMPQVDETSTLGPFGGFECSSYFRMPQKMQGATSTVIVSQSKPNVQPEPFGPSVFVPINAPAPAPLRPSGGQAKLDELPPQQPNTSPVKKQTTTAAVNEKEQQKSAPKQQQSGKQQQKESQYNGYVVDEGGRKTAPVTSTTLTMPTGTSILG